MADSSRRRALPCLPAGDGDDDQRMTTDDLDRSELEAGPHEDEPHEGGLNNRLNWLRAGVLGANDGIVSTAGIVMGVGRCHQRPRHDPGRRGGRAGGGRAQHGRRGVRLGQHPDGLRAGAAGQGAPRAAGRARRRSSRSWPGCTSRRGSARSWPSRWPSSSPTHDALGAHAEAELGIDPDDITSPWNAALRLDARVHARRAAAAAHHHAVRPDAADLGHRRLGDRRAGAHRLGEREVRLRALAPGRRAQRASAGCSRWRSPTRSDLLSAPTSSLTRMRLFAALVPPPEALEHLDEFLDVRRDAGEFRWVPGRPGARDPRLPRARCRTTSSTTWSSGWAGPRPGGPPFETRDLRRRRVPERRAREGAVGRPRPRRARPHRAGPARHRLPGRGQPRGHRGRRRAVPAAPHRGPHQVSARRQQLGPAARLLRGASVAGRRS